MVNIIKKNIQYSLIFFILFITFQWLFRDDIQWGQIIGISILYFLFNIFYDWAKIPYKWIRLFESFSNRLINHKTVTVDNSKLRKRSDSNNT